MTAVTRRDMGRLALGGAALTAWGTSARAQAVTITVNGSGGSLAKSLERIYEKPFTAETGVGVRATAPVSLAKLKAMVELTAQGEAVYRIGVIRARQGDEAQTLVV